MTALAICWLLWGTVWDSTAQLYEVAWRPLQEFTEEAACADAGRARTEANEVLEMTEEQQGKPPVVTTRQRLFHCRPCEAGAPKG